MFKLIYSHINSKDLTFTNKEFKIHSANGDILNPHNWQAVLIIFGLIKIKL